MNVLDELDAFTNTDTLSTTEPLDCKSSLIDVKLPQFIYLCNSLIRNNNKLVTRSEITLF